MSTTKSEKTTNGNQSSNNAVQPKAVAQISRFQFLRLAKAYCDIYLQKALETTKNGALKVTSAVPDCKGDVKGNVTVGDKIFYLVPSSPSRKGIFTAVVSYLDIVDAIRIWNKKLENTKTKVDYLASAEGQRRVDTAYNSAVTAAQNAIDIAKKQLAAAKVAKAVIDSLKPTPVDLAEIKDQVYKQYLSERGLSEEPKK